MLLSLFRLSRSTSDLKMSLKGGLFMNRALHEVLACIRTFERPSRGRIRNNDIERRPLAQRDRHVPRKRRPFMGQER